jgi:hypothetical protein
MEEPKNGVRIISMAATAFTGSPFVTYGPAVLSARLRSRRRQIDPQSGHALEILGHAIEYLTDEFVHHGGSPRGSLSSSNPQLEAIQLLMALNRQVYFACPEVPTFIDRFRALLHLRSV